MSDKSSLLSDASEHVQNEIDEVEAERVRLVIWDLDDTFWQGTLTEGGIKYIQENHDIVIELSKRGILNSICSRNDHASIEAVMRDKQLWDYFVFPSIDWSSKGPRLQHIVDASQLRPTTILFIDDNPMNRAEARRFVKGMQVWDPNNISSLLENPLFKGKDDRNLTRLSQYKLLERRKQDMKVADDSSAFLRDSGITVYIDHDIEPNIDRAIELINRTNQLNFTKMRLSEDQELARCELLTLLRNMEVQAGLVRVFDRYGDYGFCGLYVQLRWLHGIKPKLVHFCFSCRTLGMDVETWLYQRLGNPDIEVKGDVLTDISNPDKVVDWIQLTPVDPSKAIDEKEASKKIPQIFIRGGCESVAVSHYFEVLTDRLISEFSFQRDGLEVRLDHSEMLRLALEDLDDDRMRSLLALGYHRSDFDTALLTNSDDDLGVYIFGMWAEENATVFRHTKLGLRVLVYLANKIGGNIPDLLSYNVDLLPETMKNGWVQHALEELQNNYEFEGRTPEGRTRENVLNAIRMLPQNSLVFLIGPSEKTMDQEGKLHDFQPNIDLNKALMTCATECDRAIFVKVDDYIRLEGDRLGPRNHYSRSVYFGLFTDVRARIKKWMSLPN